jgi:hypothetical protein
MLGLLLAGACIAACASAPAGGEAIVRAVPFAAGERLVYSLHNLAGDQVGRGTLAVRAGDAGALTLVQAYMDVRRSAPTQPIEVFMPADATSITVDALTLRPFAVDRKVQGASDPLRVAATYAAGGADVTITREGEKPRTLRLGPNAYANESALWLWRTLPLAEGYTQRYVSVDATEGAVSLVSVTVKARERIEVPAGAFDSWRVLVRGGRATGVAWINVEAPHQVVQWDNGAIVFRLVEVGR